MRFISYSLAALASICFISGVAVLSGGILVSISMLFGGLALTVMTIKNEDEKKKEDNDEQIY